MPCSMTIDEKSRERLEQGFSPFGLRTQDFFRSLFETLNHPCLYPDSTDKRGFKYHPLYSASHHIRILRLHKGRLYDPIQCSLISVPLESEKCCYKALSYAWGDLHDLLPIQVDGCRFQVTRNLKSALQHLRSPDTDMDLWVDAICVDQSPNNSMEKSNQVTMMTEIYRSAKQVLIWLGPSSQDSDLIMRFFNEEGRKLYNDLDENLVDKHILGVTRSSLQVLEDRRKALRTSLFDPIKSRLRRSLEFLFRRDYWERVWVVQEIMTAKDINMVCGLYSAKYNHAMAILSEFHAKLENDFFPSPSEERKTKTQAEAEFAERLANPEVSGDSTTAFHYQPIIMTPLKIAKERLFPRHGRDAEWLRSMLVGLRHFKSSKPEDKIFSLMGIISPQFRQGEDYVPVDYGHSLFQVSLHLFKFCVARDSSGALNIMAASQPTGESSFPSWLPDFSSTNGMVQCPPIDEVLWEPEGRSTLGNTAIQIFDGGKTLQVNGRVLATVSGITGDEDDPLATDRLALLSRIHSSVALAGRDGFSKHDTLWNILAMDTAIQSSTLPRSLESLEGSLKTWETFQIKDFVRQFRRMSYGRRFATLEAAEPVGASLKFIAEEWPNAFWEEDGWGFSMCPSGTQEGDLVCEMCECQYLVLLRPSNPDGNFFKFVGVCYAPYFANAVNTMKGYITLSSGSTIRGVTTPILGPGPFKLFKIE